MNIISNLKKITQLRGLRAIRQGYIAFSRVDLQSVVKNVCLQTALAKSFTS